MEVALCQEAEDDAVEWESEDSSDYDYPGTHHQGARRVNIGQLWGEHHTSLADLPAYLQHCGGGDENLPLPLLQGNDRTEEKN